MSRISGAGPQQRLKAIFTEASSQMNGTSSEKQIGVRAGGVQKTKMASFEASEEKEGLPRVIESQGAKGVMSSAESPRRLEAEAQAGLGTLVDMMA